MDRTAISFQALKSISDVAGVPPGFNVLLMPWGKFSAMDGRPADVGLEAWTLDASAAAAVVARFDARKTPMVIDYEHQTIASEANGQPAPAAGWIEQLCAVVNVGLVAMVKWTDRAKQLIAADEYRFVSPVFGFDRASGSVRMLKHAGLVNDPGLSAQSQSVALKLAEAGTDFLTQTTNGERSMDLLVSLRAALGLGADVTAESALLAVQSLKTKADGADGQIATLKACQFDAAKHVEIVDYKAVNDELVALKATTHATEVATLVEGALKDGKLVPAQKAWAEKMSIEALKEFIKDAPAVVPGHTQTQGEPGASAEADSPQAVALKASKYMADELAAGRVVGSAQAVAYVTRNDK